jgi:hypothetical protein
MAVVAGRSTESLGSMNLAHGLIVTRIGLAAVGSVALYVVIYGGTGLLAETIGYDSTVGHAAAMINEALSFLAFGFVAVPVFAGVLFWILHKFAF